MFKFHLHKHSIICCNWKQSLEMWLCSLEEAAVTFDLFIVNWKVWSGEKEGLDLKALDGLQTSWLWNIRCIFALLSSFWKSTLQSPKSYSSVYTGVFILYTKLGGDFPMKIKACIFNNGLYVEFLPNKNFTVSTVHRIKALKNISFFWKIHWKMCNHWR